jgi:hypothetical protein
MYKLTIAGLFAMVTSFAYADQSVYIDQVSGDSLNLTIVQGNGDGNEVGQPLNGSPYLVIEGNSQTYDLLQSGASNKFFGSIQGDSLSFDVDQVGDTNEFDIMVSYGSNSDYVLSFTGNSNNLDFDMGQSVSSEYTTLSYTVVGDSNSFTTVVDSDGATQTFDMTGDGNNLTLTQTGYGSSLEGHEMTLTQETTLVRSYIELDLSGDNQTISITQSD